MFYLLLVSWSPLSPSWPSFYSTTYLYFDNLKFFFYIEIIEMLLLLLLLFCYYHYLSILSAQYCCKAQEEQWIRKLLVSCIESHLSNYFLE